MWEYRHTDELYHYGIPGMKWGHRKIDRLKKKQNDLQRNNQVGTKKYIDTSNKLYLAKKKAALKKAKKSGNTVTIQNTKDAVRLAKLGKDLGAGYLDGTSFKSVYGYSKTSKEGRAITSVSYDVHNNQDRASRALKTIGRIGITAAITAPAWYPVVKSGMDFMKTSNLKTVKYDWKTGTISAFRK